MSRKIGHPSTPPLEPEPRNAMILKDLYEPRRQLRRFLRTVKNRQAVAGLALQVRTFVAELLRHGAELKTCLTRALPFPGSAWKLAVAAVAAVAAHAAFELLAALLAEPDRSAGDSAPSRPRSLLEAFAAAAGQPRPAKRLVALVSREAADRCGLDAPNLAILREVWRNVKLFIALAREAHRVTGSPIGLLPDGACDFLYHSRLCGQLPKVSYTSTTRLNYSSTTWCHCAPSSLWTVIWNTFPTAESYGQFLGVASGQNWPHDQSSKHGTP